MNLRRRTNIAFGRTGSLRLSRRHALGVALAGAGAMAAACGRGSGSSTSKTTTASSQPGKPKYGGQLNVSTPADWSDFDPTGKSSENKASFVMAYDGLLSLKVGDGVKPTDVVLQSGLADKWETPDGQTFTFHLHPGAKFANLPPVNGREVTSADVKWSLEYLSRTGQFQGDKKLPAAINAWAFAGMNEIQTPDATTVVVRFNAPYVPFLTYAAQSWSAILAHEVYDKDGNFSSTLVGTGPWQLDTASTQRGARWVFKKNPTYFKQGLPYLDQVNWLILLDPATQNAAFASKQLDILGADFSDIYPKDLATLSKANPSAIKIETPGSGGELYMTVDKAPLNDIRVRQAIMLCINRDEFIKVFGAGDEQWALAGAMAGLFTQDETKPMLKYDPAQAKQLISAAGFPNGVDLEMIATGVANGGDTLARIQLLQAQLKNGNINQIYVELDKATAGQRKKKGQFQLSLSAGGYIDPDEGLTRVFYSKSAGNYSRINDPELDKLILSQRQQIDPAKRKDVERQAAQRIVDQSWMPAFFYSNDYQYAQNYVKNYGTSTAHDGAYFTEVWLEK